MPASKTIREKQSVYKRVLGTEDAREVLSDLRAFCYATKTTFDPCPYEMSRREGRREVFLQIMNMLKVDFGDVYDYEVDYLNAE